MNMEKIKNLAEKGFRFFPCFKTKAPATKHGFYDATSDKNRIDILFDKNEYLVGFPCGEVNKNIVVLDVDVNKDGDTRSVDDLLDELETIIGPFERNGFQSETQSGGRHLYFKAPANIKIPGGTRYFDKTLPIDFQSEGKYVIFPDDENYFIYDSDINIENFYDHIPELPEAIINFKKDRTNNDIEILPDNILPADEIREIRSALAFLSSDDRDTWIKVGLALKSTGSPSAFGLWNEWSKTSDKYNPDDMEKRWSGLKPSGDITIASLFHLAQNVGWVSTYTTQPVKTKQTNEIVVKTLEEITPNIEQMEIIKKEYHKKPFPVDLLRPDGLVGEMIDYILDVSIKPQPVFALSAALAAVGTLAGRKYQVAKTGNRTNIYCLNVGESGCGKEAPRQAIRRMFDAAGCMELASTDDLSSDVAIVNKLNEMPAQLFLLDEIGKFIENVNSGPSYLNKINDVLLKAYGVANSFMFGKDYADVEKKVKIDQPNLCLLGTTVPRTLYKGLQHENLEDGFLSRMLIFETDDHRQRKEYGKDITVKPPQRLIDKIKYLHKKPINMVSQNNIEKILVPDPQKVEKTENSQIMIDQFDSSLEDHRDELHAQDKTHAIYNRTAEIGERIALILAVGINADNPVITEKEILFGTRLAKFLADHMSHVAEHHVAKNDLEHEHKRILNLIRKNGCVPFSEISKQTQNMQNYMRVSIIETLKDSQQIEEHSVQRNGFVQKYYTAKI